MQNPCCEFILQRNVEGIEDNFEMEHLIFFRYSLFLTLSICYRSFQYRDESHRMIHKEHRMIPIHPSEILEVEFWNTYSMMVWLHHLWPMLSEFIPIEWRPLLNGSEVLLGILLYDGVNFFENTAKCRMNIVAYFYFCMAQYALPEMVLNNIRERRAVMVSR